MNLKLLWNMDYAHGWILNFTFLGGKHEYVTFAFVFSKEFFSVLQFLPLSGMNIYNDCKHSFNCIFCWFILNIFDFTDKLAIDSRKRSISICQLLLSFSLFLSKSHKTFQKSPSWIIKLYMYTKSISLILVTIIDIGNRHKYWRLVLSAVVISY